MAKATKTIKQPLGYKGAHASWFAATKTLFNQVAAFYFEVIQAHPGTLDLSSKEALTALEKLTHTTKDNPRPVMPLSDVIPAALPALFRRAAIHAALGSAHSFYTHPDKWDVKSPTLVQDGPHWNLHTAVQKQFSPPSKVEQQLATNSETRLCSIDLNITQHLAVCTIQTVEGTVVATRFIGGGKQLHG